MYKVILIQQTCLHKFSILPQEQLPSHLPSLAREMDPSGWTMCSALGMKADLLLVPAIQLAIMTVATVKMLVLDVKVGVARVLCIMRITAWVQFQFTKLN